MMYNARGCGMASALRKQERYCTIGVLNVLLLVESSLSQSGS